MRNLSEMMQLWRQEITDGYELSEKTKTAFKGKLKLDSDAGEVVIFYNGAERQPGRHTGENTIFDFGNGKITIYKSGSIYVSGLGEADMNGKTVRPSLQLKIFVNGSVFFESNRSR